MGNVKEVYGASFLQRAQLVTPVYLAFRCILLRDRELERQKNCLAIVKSAETKPIMVSPNSQVTIKGYTDKELDYHPVCAMVNPTKGSSLPDDLDITPALFPYRYGDNGTIKVHITNVSTRTVMVQPRAILCELQPVQIEDVSRQEEDSTDDVLDEIDFSSETLSAKELRQGKELVNRYRDIFSVSDTDIGLTSFVKHRIELKDPTPFKQKHRRIPPSMIEEIRSHLQQLIASGVIRRSHSPWASNVVLVRKKDQTLRMCVDYRQLNDRTIKDSYALPRIEEILDALSGNKFFSVIDMKSGYHQVEMAEEHKERTAFTVGPLGFYEFTRMPFGLANSPATYQRLMEEVLGDLNLRVCFIYLDDVIVFADTFEEHLRRLEMVMQRFRETGLKLSPKKCSLFKSRVKYVGHIVSEDGVEPDPDKISKVQDWPVPTSPEEVRKFLGFVGYYRRFIPSFSKTARPLTNLMPTANTSKRKSKKTALPSTWKWGQEEQEAFNQLKSCLTSFPILAYPDFTKPFELHVDACLLGLGAVLYQESQGMKRVIAYASRGLSKSEKRYPAHKLEFLALKWAITEKFQDYLLGKEFTVLTDNNPLTYVLTSAKLDATSQRWIAALASFNFNILYRPGRANADADSMSRLPGLLENREDEGKTEISSDVIQAICNSGQGKPFLDSLTTSQEVVDDLESTTTIEAIDIGRAQKEDDDLKWWIPYIKNGTRPQKDTFNFSPVDNTMYRNFDRLIEIEGIVYRRTTIDSKERKQLIIPRSHIPVVLKLAHDEMGHQGRDKTTSLLRDRFFWCGMAKDIENYVRCCERCIKRKTPTNEKAPLVSIVTHEPLELVCMDFLSLETSKGGFQNILVITDHFTRYAIAIPTRNQTAKTTAEAFINNFVVHYGLPKRIHSDQGANFESHLIKEVCNITGMKKSHTTPYHAMGNGLCERMNRTLLSMLGTLDPDAKRDWKSHVATLVHAYNCTRQDSTEQSPYSLMFGREPNLPMDLLFGLDSVTYDKPITKYAEELKQRLKDAYRIAAENSKKAKDRQKTAYDRKARSGVIEPGDLVLVKIVAFDGKHKLSDKWEEEAYVVLDKPNSDIPVYTVQKRDGDGRKRTLHRNLLLPVTTIWHNNPEERKEERPRPVPRRRQKPKPQVVTEPDTSKTDDEDSEDDVIIDIRDAYVPQDVRTHQDADVSREESSVATVAEDDGDAPFSDRTVSEEEELAAEVETQEAAEQQAPPISAPRRSQRTRRPPDWFRSGEYVMSAQHQPEWIKRAEYLRSLTDATNLKDYQKDVMDAIVKIVTNAT